MAFQAVSFDGDFAHIIDGKKVASHSYLDVVNPANQKPFASVPIATRQQLDDAVAAATKAFPKWAATPLPERQAAVVKFGHLLAQFKGEFMTLLTKEQGKPRETQSAWELDAAQKWCHGIAKQSLPDQVVLDTPERTAITRHVPLGVCAAIVPWNAPILLMIWKLAPALVTGNTVILKPSPYTPLCNLKFVELAQQILPPGVLNVLSGDDNLGPWLTEHPGIAKVSFTGSSATGKLVMKSASTGIKRLTLELGGNDPAIVLPDVDPKEMAPILFWAAFFKSGQVCGASKRIYIHEDAYDAVRDELVAFARTNKVGDGMDPKSDLGPIQNKPQHEKVKRHLDDAKAAGLKFALGGDYDPNSLGYFIPIAIIDNPPDDSRIVREEPFGPLVPLLKWKDDEEVIRRANDTEYGLSGTVWGKDIDRATRIAERIEAGTIWVNEFFQLDPDIPYGGHKTSGLGVANGLVGLAEWTNLHTVFQNKVAKV